MDIILLKIFGNISKKNSHVSSIVYKYTYIHIKTIEQFPNPKSYSAFKYKFLKQSKSGPLPKEGFLSTKNLHRGGGVLGQICQATSMRNESGTHLENINITKLNSEVSLFTGDAT